jgi:uncharacterized RDD family membrane protein YckC|tara:strand:- start:2644 stop:3045 length:402 start_codon:yes stop_codon:yes gene_type:complete
MSLVLKRIIAFYIDSFISVILSLIIYYVYNNSLVDFNDLNQTRIIGTLQLIVLITYYIIIEYKFNTTFGKKVMGLKVLFLISKEEKLKAMIIRTLSRLIPFDIISFTFNNKGNLWHDSLSKTKVVNKNIEDNI